MSAAPPPAPSPIALELAGPTRLFITIGMYGISSDAEAGDVIITAEPASDLNTYALTGATRWASPRRAEAKLEQMEVAESVEEAVKEPGDFPFSRPVLIPPDRVEELIGPAAVDVAAAKEGAFQTRVTEETRRRAIVELVEESEAGFGEWLDPPTRVWMTAGDPKGRKDLNELSPGHTVDWVVPPDTRMRDYVLFWLAGTGFRYVMRALDDAEPAGGTNRVTATLRIIASFESPVAIGALREHDVLAEWRILKQNFQGITRNQPEDLLAQSDVWGALAGLIVETNPYLQPLIERIDAGLPAPALANVLQSRLPGYTRDLPSGERDQDLLGLQAEYRTIATILAARRVQPPLAIGLFGDWGSGKSFFIKQVKREVDEAAALAAKETDRWRAQQAESPTVHEAQAPGPPEIAFHENIIQIEFNAWHYSEGNLWASLVDHLFTSLRDQLRKKAGKDEEKAVTDELHRLLNELDAHQEAETAARTKLTALQEEEKLAREEVEKKQGHLATAESTLITARHRDVWQGVSTSVLDAPLREALRTAAKRHGYPELADDVQKITTLGRRIGELGQRGEVVWRTLRRSGLGPWKVWFLAGVILLAIVIGPILDRIPDLNTFLPALSQGLTIVLGGVAWVAGRSKWLGEQLSQVESFLDHVDTARTAIEKKVRENEIDREHAIGTAEANLAHLRHEIEAAERVRAEASRQQIQLLGHIERRLPERRLAEFIEERANSKDYREKLGVMALVRRDFERLSALLTQSSREDPRLDAARARLRAGGGEPVGDAGAQPKPDEDRVERRTVGSLPRIDRIILYIDDLDRCTSNKVVEVLRAVHLLLAFRLFVVVVAVDPRWVSRSLELCHEELLLDSVPDTAIDTRPRTTSEPTRTTASDYLEKIFQVPYWVPTFTPRASQRMLRGLLRDQLDLSVETSSAGAEASMIDEASVLREIDRGLPYVVEPPRPVREVPPEPELNPRGLLITPVELQQLVRMAPLAGASPRQVKRYTNLYRLVKVSLGSRELDELIGDGERPGGCVAVAVLLGVATGAPMAAAQLFELIEGLDEQTTLEDLLRDLTSGPPRDGVASARYARFGATARRLLTVLPETPLYRKDLVPWLPAIRRYSFASIERV